MKLDISHRIEIRRDSCGYYAEVYDHDMQTRIHTTGYFGSRDAAAYIRDGQWYVLEHTTGIVKGPFITIDEATKQTGLTWEQMGIKEWGLGQ